MPEMSRWLRYQTEAKVTDDNDASIDALLAEAADIMNNADEVLAKFECAEVAA